MKIALAHKRLDKSGGTELDLYRTATGLRDLGHEVHLFCGEFAIDPPLGTFAHSIPILPLGRTARLWSFATVAPRIIRSYSFDLVMNFGRMFSQDVHRSGGGAHRTVLQKLGEEGGLRRRLWHGLSPYHRSVLALERQQFRQGHYKRILAVSEAVKRELSANYAVPEDKVTVIYNGVDHKRFHPGLRDQFRETVRKQWHIPRDAPVVLFVGNSFHRKGLDRLLRVWSLPQLKESYLLVVGDEDRPGRYKALAQRVAGGRVVFVGRRDDVERYYGAADLLALPAVKDAFGNVVLEALASGLPAVVSKDVGAAEVLRGALAEGIIVHPEDPEEIATRLLAMLERSRDPSFSSEARKLSEEYSWRNHFAKLDRFLKETVAAGGLPRSSKRPLNGWVVNYHPEFVLEKRGSLSIQMVRTLTEELLPKIVPEPDHLFDLPDCEIIKDEKKIKVARVRMEIERSVKTVYVKRYSAFSWRYRFGALFESSRALRSLSGATILAESGIQTARPLAAVESRSWGMLNRCFFLSEEIEGGKTTGAYWQQDLLTVRGKEGMRGRRRFMRGMGELFRSLHKQGIYHNDLKDANIVVRPDSNGGAERFYLVDLEGIRRYRRLNRRRQVKNLVQLNLSLGTYLRPTDKLRFLASYLGPLFSNRIHKRNWVASVTGQSNRLGSLRKTKISS